MMLNLWRPITPPPISFPFYLWISWKTVIFQDIHELETKNNLYSSRKNVRRDRGLARLKVFTRRNFLALMTIWLWLREINSFECNFYVPFVSRYCCLVWNFLIQRKNELLSLLISWSSNTSEVRGTLSNNIKTTKGSSMKNHYLSLNKDRVNPQLEVS